MIPLPPPLGSGEIRLSCIDQERHHGRWHRGDPVLHAIADGFITAHAALYQAADDLERSIKAKAKSHPVARRLMTIPGVGPIVSLSFVALVDDPCRFGKSSDVGAFLSLTPRRHQSGEMGWSCRVSKCGDPAMRGLLFEAASSVLRQVKHFSALKSWAVRLAGRRGFRKATVATARKIAVLMLTLWKSGADYRWTKEAVARSEFLPEGREAKS